MINITHKHTTHRIAIAEARLSIQSDAAWHALMNKEIPKGDVLEASRIAALFAVKNTAMAIPDCHTIPIECTIVNFELKDKTITSRVEVQSIARTGLEMEALYAASVAALTQYDMLKPLDKSLVIHSVQLIEKSGGKSDYSTRAPENLKTKVIVCSDSIFNGKKEDKAGQTIKEKLANWGVESQLFIIPDDSTAITNQFNASINDGTLLLIYCGGTGISPRDQTPDTIRPLLESELPGIAEQIRHYGQSRTPYAMLSRSFAGMKGNMLVLGLPGSTRGAGESIDALFPALFHVFETRKGKRHD